MEKRSHSSQKKQYKYTLKASLKDFNIPTVMGTDCTVGEYEAKRISKTKQKQKQQKDWFHQPSWNTQTVTLHALD